MSLTLNFKDEMKAAVARRREALHTIDDSWFCGYVTGYCDNHDCEAREFTVKVKGYADDLLKLRTLHCPICGGTKIFTNKILTLHEHIREEASGARMNVNAQKALREKAKNGEKHAILSLNEILNDALT